MAVIKSVLRVCEVFEFFQDVRRPVALKEIVERFGYPPSSSSVLMKSLVELGYIEYDADRRKYFLTMRMTTMVDWVERARFGSGSILAAMRRIHEATSEAVSLGAQSDLHAQYIYQIPGTLPLPYPRLRQTVRAIEKSGMGWLLLSGQSDEAISTLLKRVNYKSRRNQERMDLQTLLARVNEIRRDGHVFSRHTVVHGAGMIGMLVPRAVGSRQLAIGVHGPVTRLETKRDLILRLLPEVIAAVGALGGS